MTPEPVMHSFNNTNNQPSGKPLSLAIVLGVIFLTVLLGVGTGYAISSVGQSPSSSTSNETSEETKGSNKTSAGVKDTKAFPDEAEGTLKEGGFEGEGSFHLERPGGQSQNVYLTSTTVDLSEFLGKKVKVWGQTFGAEKAGWLMDVGYIEVL